MTPVIFIHKQYAIFNGFADISDHADVLCRVYADLLTKIEALSVARHMFQSNALTDQELQSIQTKHETVKATERLLNIVIKGSENVFLSFLDALKKTGHQHVCEVINSCKGTKDDVIVLPDTAGGAYSAPQTPYF